MLLVLVLVIHSLELMRLVPCRGHFSVMALAQVRTHARTHTPEAGTSGHTWISILYTSMLALLRRSIPTYVGKVLSNGLFLLLSTWCPMGSRSSHPIPPFPPSRSGHCIESSASPHHLKPKASTNLRDTHPPTSTNSFLLLL
ncbi:uncharacterized protein LY79DRAFT_253266 [Colletotrichum navitas]|uniref:Secreted protein n=1 Tax=Colletotrichum navitas TaxID=681940 RepID=A0AAD8VB91_9PEZI|nr:uncharacterized protein LY79DRAFT_253266 [Colletotrichum navitas]KAK1598716.1 hypothetical protein LY79DRAFT_253266 [Colletotrichum navitas]